MTRRARGGHYRAALRAELLKARRSRVPLATLGAATFAGLLPGVFFLILIDPDRARRAGLLRQKADLSGLSADWPGLLDFLSQIVAVGDLMLFAFIVTWVFGRESVDGTLRYLLALPVPRSTVVAAKFTVVTGWAVAVDAWMTGMVLGTGGLLGLGGGGAGVLAAGLEKIGLAAGLMLVVTTPIAWVACAGRGYLAPLAVALVVLVVGQVAGALGWAARWPWSVPAVAADLAPGAVLDGPAVVLAAGTGLAGVLATLAWWRSGHAGGGA